jgi:acetyl esterase
MQKQSSQNLSGTPVLEPNIQAFLDALAAKGGPQIYELPIPEARGVLVSAQADPVATLPADIEDRAISGRNRRGLCRHQVGRGE